MYCLVNSAANFRIHAQNNPYILSVILTNKHNHTDLIKWLLIQCYYMFWLSTSAIIR